LPVSIPALYKPRLIDTYKFELLSHSIIREAISKLQFPLKEKELAKEFHAMLMENHRSLLHTREQNRVYLEKRPVTLPDETIIKVTGILCPTCYRVYSTCSQIQLGQDLLYVQPE
jgi:hypothetical protein